MLSQISMLIHMFLDQISPKLDKEIHIFSPSGIIVSAAVTQTLYRSVRTTQLLWLLSPPFILESNLH